MKTYQLFAGLVVAAVGSAAMGSIVSPAAGVFELNGSAATGGYTPRTPVGVSYSVYTGVTSATNQLFLIDTTTAGGDVRVFGDPAGPINPYVNNTTRTVSETAVANGSGGYDITITVTGSGNLFPSGFTGGTPPVPLTGAGVGLGLNLGARGSGALLFPENLVTSATLSLVRASGTNGSNFTLPPATFFGAPGAWSGSVGISVANIATAANEVDPFVQVVWTITTAVPAPGVMGLAGIAGLVVLRRRR